MYLRYIARPNNLSLAEIESHHARILESTALDAEAKTRWLRNLNRMCVYLSLRAGRWYLVSVSEQVPLFEIQKDKDGMLAVRVRS